MGQAARNDRQRESDRRRASAFFLFTEMMDRAGSRQPLTHFLQLRHNWIKCKWADRSGWSMIFSRFIPPPPHKFNLFKLIRLFIESNRTRYGEEQVRQRERERWPRPKMIALVTSRAPTRQVDAISWKWIPWKWISGNVAGRRRTNKKNGGKSTKIGRFLRSRWMGQKPVTWPAGQRRGVGQRSRDLSADQQIRIGRTSVIYLGRWMDNKSWTLASAITWPAAHSIFFQVVGWVERFNETTRKLRRPIKTFLLARMNETLKFGNAAAANRANPGVKRFNFSPQKMRWSARWSVQVTGRLPVYF